MIVKDDNMKITSEELETAIVYYSIHNFSFFLRFKEHLKTRTNTKSYFDDTKLQLIYNILCRHQEKYETMPTTTDVLLIVSRMFGEKAKTPDEDIFMIISSMIKTLFKLGSSDMSYEFVVDETVEFIKKNRIFEAFLHSQLQFQNGEYDKIAEHLTEATSINFDTDLGLSIREVKKNIELLNDISTTASIPSGYLALDDILDGGFDNKTLNVFAATPGVGKCLFYQTDIEIILDNVERRLFVGDLFKELGLEKQGEYEPPKGLKIKTTDGYKKVNALLKTQPNPEWVIKTETGRRAIFTDKHKLEVKYSEVFDVGKYWKNLEDLQVGELVNTDDGWERITNLYWNKLYSNMYDMEVDEVKSFYANGFNSHNTLILGNFAINAFLDNKKALVITFETSDKRLLSRYISNIATVKGKEIIVNASSVEESMTDIISSTDGDIRIKEYPANAVSSNDLVGLINDLIRYEKWKPDVIIVDYILIMLTNDKSLSSDNSYKYYKTVSEELRNIGVLFDTPILSAAQINRQGMGDTGGTKAITTSKDVSESRGIYDTCDSFFTINQTTVQKEKGEVMLYCDKNRNGETGSKTQLGIDYDFMKLENK